MKLLFLMLFSLFGLAAAPTPAPAPTAAAPQDPSVAFIKTAPARVTLIANFAEKKSSSAVVEENRCTAAVNGGFYDKTNKPLGYFAVGENVTGAKIRSALVNGFLFADASGSAFIAPQLPGTKVRFALQTGPILVAGTKAQPLSLNDDTPARRMVAATTKDSLIFLAVYSQENVFSGPKLSDLPEIVMAQSQKENLGIVDAINLDGGSASAFYNGGTKLSELTPVGSLFCIK